LLKPLAWTFFARGKNGACIKMNEPRRVKRSVWIKTIESHFCLIGTLIRPMSFRCHCNQIGGEREASTPLYLSPDYKISILFFNAKGKKNERKKKKTPLPYKSDKRTILFRAWRKCGSLIAAQELILLC